VTVCRLLGGLEAVLHHHGREPFLRLLRQVAVHHPEGEEKDQVWQTVRLVPKMYIVSEKLQKIPQILNRNPNNAHFIHCVILAIATFLCRYTIYSPKDGQPCMDHDRQTGEVQFT